MRNLYSTNFNSLFAFSKKNLVLLSDLRNRYYPFGVFCFVALLFLSPFFFFTSCLFYPFKNKSSISNKIISISFSFNQRKILSVFDYINYDFSLNKKTCFRVFKSVLIHGLNINLLLNSITKINNKNFIYNWKRLLFSIIIEPDFYSLLKLSKTCIVANDHSIQNLLLIDCCKQLNVNTVYIQHAPVNQKFLPLQTDLSVLFSQWAFDTYKLLGSKAKKAIIICDIPIAILKGKITVSNIKNKSVLICINLLDNLKIVKNLCDFLSSNGFIVTLRPHPADKRDLSAITKNISKNEDLAYSFNNNKYIIVNETAVILEAIATGKLVYKYLFSPSLDNYGLLKKGVVKKEFIDSRVLLNSLINEEITFSKDNLIYFTGNLYKFDYYISKTKEKIEML